MEKKRRGLILGGLFAVGIGGLLWYASVKAKPPPKPPVAPPPVIAPPPPVILPPAPPAPPPVEIPILPPPFSPFPIPEGEIITPPTIPPPTAPPMPPTIPPPTLPPAPVILVIDKSFVARGDIVNWFASNLKIGQIYGVGISVNGRIYWDPSRDKFVANAISAAGRYIVPDDTPLNTHEFVIFEADEEWRIVAKVPITVIAPPTAPPTIPTPIPPPTEIAPALTVIPPELAPLIPP
jgi:hypothetical protein